MSDEQARQKAMQYIESVAQESPNRHAFYRGMVFGLGHSAQFIKQFDREEALAWIYVLLGEIEEQHFKDFET